MFIVTVFLSVIASQAQVPSPILLGERKPLAKKPAAAVEAGLEWLRLHQEEEGFWSSADFPERDKLLEEKPSDGAGSPVNSIGATGLAGLAVLAFLGDERLARNEKWREATQEGLNWLIKIQDKKTGLFGDNVGNPTAYQHAIAMMAVAEGVHYGVLEGDRGRAALVLATRVLSKERVEDSGWAYFSTKSPDTSLTGWCVLALLSARDVGVEVPNTEFEDARNFLIGVTDMSQGLTGYNKSGFTSARPLALYEKYPARLTPATTAISLLIQRTSIDIKKVPRASKHPHSKLLKSQQSTLLEYSPSENPKAYDPYYWFFGAQAMHQAGSSPEKKWQRALQPLVLDCQRDDGNFSGSWDPKGPWGSEGGRVVDTALVILSLQGPVRYQRVLK